MDKENKYCVWHKTSRKVAVNLNGTPLDNLTKLDANDIMLLIDYRIRPQVEVRIMPSLLPN